MDTSREVELLAGIVANARTLWERIEDVDPATLQPLEAPAMAEALAPWARVLGGDPQALERRLAWDGIDPRRAAAALAAPPRGARPAWADDLEAYAARAARFAVRAGRGRARELAADVPFADLWLPWVELAVERLRRAAGPAAAALDDAGWGRLEGPLLREVAWLSEAAAYELFDGLRTAAGGEHAGIHEAFLDFCLADPLAVLYQVFPVLARQTCRLVQQWVESRAELLVRLAADRPALGAAFGDGTDPGPALGIGSGLSDRHAGGRQVLRVELASGLTVIYKPRDLGPEAALATFLEWCRREGARDVPPGPRALRRPGYGWMAAESVADLPDRPALERYHRRAGALLAIAHVLDIGDLHAENLVATAEGPVVVDAEVLLQPERERLGTGEVAVEEGPRRPSILRTGLLGEPGAGTPRPAGAPAPAQRLDGLRVARHRNHRRGWQDVGRDSLRGEVEEVESAPLPNVPRHAGVPVGADAHTEAVCAGFATTYRFLLARRGDLVAAEGRLATFAGLRARVLLRASQDYWRVLQLGSLPRNQRSGLAGSWLAEALLAAAAEARERPVAWPLVAAERQALDRGDVPRFVVATTGTVPQPAASMTSGLFATAGLEAARRRLADSGVDDLEEQLVRLRWALGIAVPARPSRALAAAGEGLAGRCRWLALDLARGICAAEPAAAAMAASPRLDLARGTLGTALFLAALRRHEASGEGLDAALRDALERRLAALQASAAAAGDVLAALPPGGLSGLGSIAWAAVTLATLTTDASWLALAGRAADALAATPVDAADAAAGFDVDRGGAGAILGLLALHAATGEAARLELAVRWGEELLRRQTVVGSAAAGWPNGAGLVQSGWSHGLAGVARALAALGRASGDSRCLVGAAAALACERQLFDAGERNWPVLLVDSRGRRRGRRFMNGYCRGAAGVALSRLYLPAEMHDEAWRHELDTALDTTATAPLQTVDHLCCGTFGRCAVLLTAAERGEAGRREQAERLAATALGRAAAAAGLAWTEDRFERLQQPPGFLRGAAGVGYVLLRLAGADLPEALALELPSETPPLPRPEDPR